VAQEATMPTLPIFVHDHIAMFDLTFDISDNNSDICEEFDANRDLFL